MSKTKELTRVQRKWIRACKKWQRILWCGDYALHWQFDNEEVVSEPDGWTPIASVSVKPQYYEAHIEANTKQLETLDDEALDRHACHEILHIVTGPYHEWGQRVLGELPRKAVEGFAAYCGVENERVVSRLMQIVWALQKKIEHRKKKT